MVSSQQPKARSFFERPEGNTGLAFIGAGLIAGGIGLYYLLPFIIILLTNILHAAALGIALFLIVGLLMNDQFRFLCWSIFKSTMRWLTGLFIAIDPIGILKNYIADMNERISDFNQNIAKLKGEIHKISRTIEERKQNANRYMKLASKAKEKEGGESATVKLNANKSRRELAFIEKLDVNLVKMTKLEAILSKLHKNLLLLKEDTEHTVEIKEYEYKSITAAHKAMKGAQALIEGDKAKDLFDQAMEHVAEDVALKLGEMDRFMEANESIFNNMDLENAVFDEEGLDLLLQWEENGSLVLNYDKARDIKVRVDSETESELSLPASEMMPIPEPATKSNSFAHVFKK